jgi:hypothetical protein
MQACAFLDGVQFDNTTCIYLLCEIIVVCIDVIHDVEEQCVTHLISMMKKSIVVDQNNFTKFNYGQFYALKLHLGYDMGKIPHVVFLPIVANLVLTTSKHQTQDQL